MKRTLIFLFPVFFLGGLSHGQPALGYNTDGNTLSLSFNPYSKLWGEFRVNVSSYKQASWTISDRGITQIYIMSRILPMENACFFAGIGTGVNLLTEGEDKWLSVNIPAGISIIPFSRFPDLFLTGEYNPMIVVQEGLPVIHTVSIGMRYRLRKMN